MKKIIIGSLVVAALIYSLAAFRCGTFNPFMWGDGSRVFVLVGMSSGVIVVIGFIRESFRNFSQFWAFLFGYISILYLLAHIVFPALTQ